MKNKSLIPCQSSNSRQPFAGRLQKLFLVIGLWVGLAAVAVGQQKPLSLAQPLEQGHSHNDYWRIQPLRDALGLGFKSIEADVFLINSLLLVGHSRNELVPEKTLESLYLQPLQNIARQHKKFYRQPGTLYLYIDFKTEGKTTYEHLRPVLAKYHHMLVNPRGGSKARKGMLKVILTGNYPPELVTADQQRLVFLDGKVEDLPRNLNPAIYPVVSGNWAKYFTWKGDGAMPPAEARQLAEWHALARQNGQQIRFWNMPEQRQDQLKVIWQELLKYPAILIGTDHLDWLAETLAEQRKPYKSRSGKK